MLYSAQRRRSWSGVGSKDLGVRFCDGARLRKRERRNIFPRRAFGSFGVTIYSLALSPDFRNAGAEADATAQQIADVSTQRSFLRRIFPSV